MTYTLSPFPTMVIRDADQAHVPFDPANMDYQKYLAWLGAGNTPAPPSIAAPPEVSQPMTEVTVEHLVAPPAPIQWVEILASPPAPPPEPTPPPPPVKGGLTGI
jgi:hypothetical protein